MRWFLKLYQCSRPLLRMFSSSKMLLPNVESHTEQKYSSTIEIHWVCRLLHIICRGGIIGKNGNKANVGGGRWGLRGFRDYWLETMDKKGQRQMLLKGNRVVWYWYLICIPACIITMRKTLGTPNNLKIRDSLVSTCGYIGMRVKHQAFRLHYGSA